MKSDSEGRRLLPRGRNRSPVSCRHPRLGRGLVSRAAFPGRLPFCLAPRPLPRLREGKLGCELRALQGRLCPRLATVQKRESATDCGAPAIGIAAQLGVLWPPQEGGWPAGHLDLGAREPSLWAPPDPALGPAGRDLGDEPQKACSLQPCLSHSRTPPDPEGAGSGSTLPWGPVRGSRSADLPAGGGPLPSQPPPVVAGHRASGSRRSRP